MKDCEKIRAIVDMVNKTKADINIISPYNQTPYIRVELGISIENDVDNLYELLKCIKSRK